MMLHSTSQWWWENIPWPADGNYKFGTSGTGSRVDQAFWKTLCADLVYSPSAFTEKNKFRRTKPGDVVLFDGWLRNSGSPASLYRRTSIVDGIFIDGGSVEEVDAAQKNEAFHRSVECATRGRTFFLTETGGMGLGPENCQTGDEVYLISGSRVPMILRASDRVKKCRGKRVERLVLSAEEENIRIAAGRPGAARTLKEHDMAKDSRCDEDHLNCFFLVGDTYVHGIMDTKLGSRDTPATNLAAATPIFLL